MVTQHVADDDGDPVETTRKVIVHEHAALAGVIAQR